MHHLNVESMMTYLDGETSEAEKSAIEAHLASCPECAELRQQLEDVSLCLSNDSPVGPPEDVLQAGIRVFPAIAPQKEGLRAILASLVDDTFDHPVLAGVRSAGARPRQLLYRARDFDVDVKIDSTEANGRIT